MHSTVIYNIIATKAHIINDCGTIDHSHYYAQLKGPHFCMSDFTYTSPPAQPPLLTHNNNLHLSQFYNKM